MNILVFVGFLPVLFCYRFLEQQLGSKRRQESSSREAEEQNIFQFKTCCDSKWRADVVNCKPRLQIPFYQSERGCNALCKASSTS